MSKYNDKQNKPVVYSALRGNPPAQKFVKPTHSNPNRKALKKLERRRDNHASVRDQTGTTRPGSMQFNQ